MGDVCRVINVLLCFMFFLLLMLRMIHTTQAGNKVYLYAIFLLLVGIITGSWENRHSPFHWAQLVTMAGIILLIVGGFMNEVHSRRQHL